MSAPNDRADAGEERHYRRSPGSRGRAATEEELAEIGEQLRNLADAGAIDPIARLCELLKDVEVSFVSPVTDQDRDELEHAGHRVTEQAIYAVRHQYARQLRRQVQAERPAGAIDLDVQGLVTLLHAIANDELRHADKARLSTGPENFLYPKLVHNAERLFALAKQLPALAAADRRNRTQVNQIDGLLAINKTLGDERDHLRKELEAAKDDKVEWQGHAERDHRKLASLADQIATLRARVEKLRRSPSNGNYSEQEMASWNAAIWAVLALLSSPSETP